jgi:8-hydroxy-5-deazaflavin:NADPH oxidoreductase
MRLQTIGLIGGTGDLGKALAFHLAKGPDTVLLGSRSQEKAEACVSDIFSEKGASQTEIGDLRRHLKPCTNQEVVKLADVVIATIPYENAVDTVRDLTPHFKGNQLFISAAAAVQKSENGEFKAPIGTHSLTLQLRDILPATVKVAAAFQTVPARTLYKGKENFAADVLVASEDKETFVKTAEIVSQIKGLRALHIGSLELSAEIESLTSILLNIGIKNGIKNPTFKVESL